MLETSDNKARGTIKINCYYKTRRTMSAKGCEGCPVSAKYCIENLKKGEGR
jgi:hypothetical protein